MDQICSSVNQLERLIFGIMSAPNLGKNCGFDSEGILAENFENRHTCKSKY